MYIPLSWESCFQRVLQSLGTEAPSATMLMLLWQEQWSSINLEVDAADLSQPEAVTLLPEEAISSGRQLKEVAPAQPASEQSPELSALKDATVHCKESDAKEPDHSPEDDPKLPGHSPKAGPTEPSHSPKADPEQPGHSRKPDPTEAGHSPKADPKQPGHSPKDDPTGHTAEADPKQLCHSGPEVPTVMDPEKGLSAPCSKESLQMCAEACDMKAA